MAKQKVFFLEWLRKDFMEAHNFETFKQIWNELGSQYQREVFDKGFIYETHEDIFYKGAKEDFQRNTNINYLKYKYPNIDSEEELYKIWDGN